MSRLIYNLAQNLRQKLTNADSKFFDEDPEDGAANSTIRKDLLTFRSAELKTVFTEVDDEIDSGPGKNTLSRFHFWKFLNPNNLRHLQEQV